MAEATLCKTKAGKGFKIVIDEVWYYTSKHELFRLLNDSARACTFRTIEDEEEEAGQSGVSAHSCANISDSDDDINEEETGWSKSLHAWQDHLLENEVGGLK